MCIRYLLELTLALNYIYMHIICILNSVSVLTLKKIVKQYCLINNDS